MTDMSPRILLFPDKRRKADCQRERPFLVVRATASTFAERLRMEAEEELKLCEKRMESEATLHIKLGCSHAKSAHYLRCLANRIEMEGTDAS